MSRQKSRWNGQTVQTGSYIRVVRHHGSIQCNSIYSNQSFVDTVINKVWRVTKNEWWLTFRHPDRPGDCQITNFNHVIQMLVQRCFSVTILGFSDIITERNPVCMLGSSNHNISRHHCNFESALMWKLNNTLNKSLWTKSTILLNFWGLCLNIEFSQNLSKFNW